MPPKKRKPQNKPLPLRWRFKHGAYYYRVPPGAESHWNGKKEFRLGKTLYEAHQTYADRIGRETTGEIVSMEQLCDYYQTFIIPQKAPATQKINLYSMQRVRRAFAGNKVALIKPSHVYQYRDITGEHESQKKANLDLELLSHMFTIAIEKGVIDDHPMTNKKVVKFSLAARTRYVEDWELMEFLSVAGDFLNHYLTLKGLLGLDKADMLSIKIPNIKDDSLVVEPRRKTLKSKKNPRQRIYYFADQNGYSTEVREAIDAILAAPRPVGSMYLFCTRQGQPYIKDDGSTSAFDSIWQRRMKRALAETKLVERFTEHDLRAKVGSDMDTDEQAQRTLDHSNINTTRNIYRRKPVVIPVGKGFPKKS